MADIRFDRDVMSKHYAIRHMKTDPGIRAIYYLPTGAHDREIRLVEVNDDIVPRETERFEAIDFGVDIKSDNSHRLLIVDMTPSQWEKVEANELQLPEGWSLTDKVEWRAPSIKIA